jgi:hypothetical protein
MCLWVFMRGLIGDLFGGKGLVGRELGSGEFGLDWMEGRLRWMGGRRKGYSIANRLRHEIVVLR